MGSSSRYCIGIDLGTTNSSLSYIDTLSDSPWSQVLAVPQLEDPGITVERFFLPSSLYLGTGQERSEHLLDLPFGSAGREFAVGQFALKQAFRAADRVVVSAKSWLCHPDVDHSAKILPWNSEVVPPGQRFSPVQVCACYLAHFKDVWNSTIGAFHEAYRFEAQEVTITVPASFDEAAQALTLLAAKDAGYPVDALRLMEEPQAAFYCWLERHGAGELRRLLLAQRSRDDISRARTVLVCDVGGGTTDFSLFSVDVKGERVEISRLAVSDHILLGGDNIDLTLAYALEKRLVQDERELTPRQWQHLIFSSRALKEQALGQYCSQHGEKPKEDEAELLHVSVPGEGSSLFSQTRSAALTRKEVLELVLNGFFPEVSADERPRQAGEGLKEWGLPFAKDSAVTRHLAAFLQGRMVDAVLCNGGTLMPPVIRKRVFSVIANWQNGVSPLLLENEHMDTAVSKGAAYFLKVHRKKEEEIAAGYARAVYLEIHGRGMGEGMPAVCILPQGTRAGEILHFSNLSFKLRVGTPVRFQLFQSTHRPADRAGQKVILNDWEFLPLPPLQTRLDGPPGMLIPKDGMLLVSLETVVSELGMLHIYGVHRAVEPRRWELAFNVRKTASAEIQENLVSAAFAGKGSGSTPQFERAAMRILDFYGKKKSSEKDESPKNLLRELEQILNKQRSEWETPLLRTLWQPLLQGITRRGRSLAHETTWLYLAGFFLRPGYGADLDPWRVKELWRCAELGLSFPKEKSAKVQWWIMWRRVCGGLSAEQQSELYSKLLPEFEQSEKSEPELARLLGSLERIPLQSKILLGDTMLSRIAGRKTAGIEHEIWALGRLASRVPLYASAHQMIEPAVVVRWFEKVKPLDWSQGDLQHLKVAMSQAGRITGDRARDLPAAIRNEIIEKLKQSKAVETQLRVLQDYVEITQADRRALFGESLPLGLELVE